MNVEINELAKLWLEFKSQEEFSVAERRDIEDRIKILADIRDDHDGTSTIEPGEYEIKIVGRIDRKIDSDRLQELAAESGLTSQLSNLFRWKPELNLAAWKAAAEEITNPLGGAITAKPGRASFKIILIGEKK